jgi:hypothetical protein
MRKKESTRTEGPEPNPHYKVIRRGEPVVHMAIHPDYLPLIHNVREQRKTTVRAAHELMLRVAYVALRELGFLVATSGDDWPSVLSDDTGLDIRAQLKKHRGQSQMDGSTDAGGQ